MALASIIDAKENGKIDCDDCILLNVSGGGVQRLKQEKETKILNPWIIDGKDKLVSRILQKLG